MSVQVILGALREVEEDSRKLATAMWSGPGADAHRRSADLLSEIVKAIEKHAEAESEGAPTAEPGAGFADGSTLPAYTDAGSLFRPSDSPDRRGRRVHVLSTNDAEHLADLWGTIVDGEPVTAALIERFGDFVSNNFGADTLTTLSARTSARFSGAEKSEPDDDATYRSIRHFEHGHTGISR